MEKQKEAFKKIYMKELDDFMSYIESLCYKSVDLAYAVNISMKAALRKTNCFKEEKLFDDAVRLINYMDEFNLNKLKNRVKAVGVYREVMELVTKRKEDSLHVYSIGHNTIMWVREEVNKRVNKRTA